MWVLGRNLSGFPTYQDLAASSNDNLRIADKPPRTSFCSLQFHSSIYFSRWAPGRRSCMGDFNSRALDIANVQAQPFHGKIRSLQW